MKSNRKIAKTLMVFLTVLVLIGPYSLNGLQYARAEGENLTVTITKSDGVTPVSGAGVAINSSNYTFYYYGYTDTNGQIQTTLTQTGTYYATVWTNDPTEVNPPMSSFTYSGTPVTLNLALVVPGVKGTVLNPNGLPAQSAGIQLRDATYTYFENTNTDTSGNFRIGSDLASGTYYLDINPSFSDYGILSTIGLAVSVTAGSTNIDYLTTPIQLEAAMKTIQGTITKPDGSLVTDAMVNAFSMDGTSGFAQDQTDQNGQYSMLIGRGNFQVMISPSWGPGGVPDWGYFDMPTSVSFTQANSVAETATADFVVTVFDSTITGRVLNPDGSIPTPNSVNINAWSAGGFGGGGSAQADEQGYFSLGVPSNGTFMINIQVNSNDYGGPEVPSIPIGNQETKNIGTIYLLEKTAHITGQVTDSVGNPLANEFVNAWQMFGSGYGNTQTDNSGNYTLSLVAGTWFVDSFPSNSGQTTYVKTQAPQRIVVGDNETKSADFTFTIADATINGMVQDNEGNTLDTLSSYAYARDVNRSVSAEGDMMGFCDLGGMVENGSFSLKVPAGTYQIGVFMPPSSNYTPSAEETITVGTGETYEGAVISLLPNNATISGSLLDRDGNPINSVWGEVFANNGAGGQQWTQFINGTYTLTVAAGDWNIGYWVDPASGYISSFGEDNTVTAIANGTVTHNITMLKADSVVSGTILDPNGQPLSNAWVSVDTELGGRSSTTDSFFGSMFNQGNISDVNGHFSVTVPEGNYFVSASMPTDQGYIYPQAQAVATSPSSPAEVTMQFRQADGTITGTVSLDDQPMANSYINAWSEDGAFSETTASSDGTYSLNIIKNQAWHVSATYETVTKFYRSDEINVAVPDSGTAAQDLALIESDITIPPAQTATFDSTESKTMQLLDGTTIDMPAYSLDTSGDVTVTATPKGQGVPSTATSKPIALAYDLTAKDSQNQLITSFQANVTITIPYTHAQLDALGITEDDITPRYYDETSGTWKTVNNVTVDKDNDTVSFLVDHFTNFALVTNKQNADLEQEEEGLELTLSSPTDNSVASTDSVSVSGTVSDATAEVTAQLNGVDTSLTVGSTGSFSTTLTGLKKGNNTLVVMAETDSDSTDISRTVAFRPTKASEKIVTVPENGSPQVRVFGTNGEVSASFYAFNENLRGKFDVLTADLNGDGTDEIIAYPDKGFSPHIRVFNLSGEFISQVFAYQEAFKNGITVEAADVNADGSDELVVLPKSGGGSNLRVYNYLTGSRELHLLDWIMAYNEGFRGQLNVETADIDRDGRDEIITVPAEKGGSNVRVYKYQSAAEGLTLVDWFTAYGDKFKGGVNLAIGNVMGDSKLEVVLSPVGQGGPNVRVYQYSSTTQEFSLADWFMAYQETYRDGVKVTLADINADGLDEIVTVPVSGGPNVRTYAYDMATAGFSLVDWFMAYAETFRGGVNVTAGYLDGDNYEDLIVTPNSATGTNLRIYEYSATTSNLGLIDWSLVYGEAIRSKLDVSLADIDADQMSEIVISPLSGGGPNVRMLNLTNGVLETSDWFMAYAETFRGGVQVTTAAN
ncbi:MAG: hypothetical protein PHH01_01290 [Patescibacteria group bacterium]|nr:hypothetical protein [Patescibacteria group bacterium]